MEKNEKCDEIKKTSTIAWESFVDVFVNTTSHAIPNILRTNSWIIKIFWFILLLGAIGASIYSR